MTDVGRTHTCVRSEVRVYYSTVECPTRPSTPPAVSGATAVAALFLCQTTSFILSWNRDDRPHPLTRLH